MYMLGLPVLDGGIEGGGHPVLFGELRIQQPSLTHIGPLPVRICSWRYLEMVYNIQFKRFKNGSHADRNAFEREV
jgi:hypothetical protein